MHLEGKDPLATLLFQICSPAHIPWGDTRWQELLHGYDVWVHIEHDGGGGHQATTDNNDDSHTSILDQACHSMAQHAATSSNLAALCLHVTRMLKELVQEFTVDIENATSTTGDGAHHPDAADHDAFSRRISRVAKARATAGALVLLRILAHPVVVKCSTADIDTDDAATSTPCTMLMEDAFTYRTRGDLARDKRAGVQLIHALMDWISIGSIQYNKSKDHSKKNAACEDLSSTPEVYDALVFAFQLLFVLCGTQLYQPFISSFQREQEEDQDDYDQQQHYVLEQLYSHLQGDGDNGLQNYSRHRPDQNFHGSASVSTSSSTHRRGGGSRNSIILEPEDAAAWTPQSILAACFEWQIRRPSAPERSISHFYAQLAQSVVTAKSEPKSADGMYETHLVVQAAKPTDASSLPSNLQFGFNHSDQEYPGPNNGMDRGQPHNGRRNSSSSKMILDATKGVLVLSSTVIMLPFRLLSLVLGVWGRRSGKGHYRQDATQRLNSLYSSRTKDVLWISDSILADLASCWTLLLVNNQRNQGSDQKNPFRAQLEALTDNRWDKKAPGGNGGRRGSTSSSSNPRSSIFLLSSDESFVGLPDLPSHLDNTDESSLHMSLSSFGDQNLLEEAAAHERRSQRSFTDIPNVPTSITTSTSSALKMNFESLFVSYGRTLHTEVGALSLYTLLQSSPKFAESLVVRSDLDTLVLPLLRTLYFSTSTRSYVGHDATLSSSTVPNQKSNAIEHNNAASSSATASASGNTKSRSGTVADPTIRNCPFRSQSQLYVIIILLLLFSQDSSFGRDAFRRITIPHVAWYKERNLKNANLGSVLVLTLLRSLLFNLLRLQDAFLLSNCCAILMNLAPSIADLHEYAAMRLASVTVSIMKRHMALFQQRQREQAQQQKVVHEEEDWTSPLSMYGEVARTLLCVLKHCLAGRNLNQNLHLVYALVYHQAGLQKFYPNFDGSSKSTSKMDLYNISEIGRIQSVTSAASVIVQEEGARSAGKALKVLESKCQDILAAAANDGRVSKNRSEAEDFNFTYEEEADPEIFFVPYLWEILVCVVTSSSVEWDKHKVRAFALFESEPPEHGAMVSTQGDTPSHQAYSNDVSDIV